MQDIIPIFTSNFNGSHTQSIDARKLHEFLEVKTKFATWVQRKIQKHRFLENIDFISVSQNRESGGKLIEYHFSTDMAKQISMLEDNKKGDEARLYFIQKEKQANNQIPQTQKPTQIDSKFLLQIAQEMAEKEELIDRQKIVINHLEIENTKQDEENQKLKIKKNHLKVIEYLIANNKIMPFPKIEVKEMPPHPFGYFNCQGMLWSEYDKAVELGIKPAELNN